MQKRGVCPKTERQVRSCVRAVSLLFYSCRHQGFLLLRLSVLAGFALTLAACGGGGGASVDPPAQNANTQTSKLSASPASIAFGSVKTGSSATQTITLTNTGSASVTVSQATATGTGFNLTGLSLPLNLAAGQSASFSAVFAPGAAGSFTGSVSIISSASDSPAAVSLTGTGAASQASVTPASVNFGSVAVGYRSTATLTMTNSGADPVTVSQVAASGTGFSVSGPSLPVTLTSGRAASFSVAFTPVTAAASTGGVSIVSSASSQPVVIPLAGTGATMTVSLSPAQVNFGSVTVGGSGSQAVALTNTGTTAVTVSQVSVSGGGFALGSLTLPFSLGAGQIVNLPVTFAPSTAGSAAGALTVVSNAANSPSAVSLTGIGGVFQLTAAPSSLSFGNVKVGSTGTQTITLTNTGNSTVTVSGATPSGAGFSLSGLTLPLTLSAGQSASFTAGFAPTTAANATGSISITSTAANSPLAVPLSGSGITMQLSASPSSVNFGSVNVGASGSQTITLTNTGTVPVTISQASASGTGFGISGLTFPLTLAAGQSANLSAAFSPTGSGSSTGSISVVSTASSSPTAISLSGTGSTTSLSLSPSSLSFGNITIGNSSVLPVVVTNNGTTSVVISQATVTGAGFSVSGQTLPLTLASGQNASFNITFDPSAGGGVTGSFSLVSNAASSPATSLSAMGANKHSVTLAWTASTSSGITGYNMYSASVSGGPYAKINSSLITSTTYTDNTVQAGDTYYYVTTAVDSSGVESSYSNQATAAIPSP